MVRQTNQVIIGLGVLLALLVLAVIGILGLPVFQTIGYSILIQSPATIWWLGLGAIGAGVLGVAGYPNGASIIAILAVVMALMIGPFMSSVYAQEHILAEQTFEERAELNETSTEHVRVLPQNVADRYAESANQLPQYSTGSSDIAYNNGTYTWSYPVEPGPFMVAWQGNQWGAFYVDMEQTSRSVTTSRTTMENGLGQVFIDSFAWQTNIERLDVDHRPGTTFVFEDSSGDDCTGSCTRIAKSYVTHDWHIELLPIPQPYAVPEYAGTMVMNPDGEIDDYSPSEVAQNDLFAGQNTYPYDLARFRMTSMQLRNGLINKLFYQKGVPEIATTGGFSDNEQPFTVPVNGEDGSAPELEYYIAATPAGAGDGIYQIYRIDGQTGAIEYVQFDSTQAGPQKAAGYTRSQNRAPNWAANNEDGSTQITEPIPLVIGSDLYWHMRVTPTDGARVSYTTFVNADTGNVYRASTTDEIYEFIRSGSAGDFENETSPDTGQNATDSDGVFTVAIVEDGDVVETFEVTQNQSVEISASASASNSNETEVAG